jgi:pyridoxamine 5'-phosphate oxidase
MNFFFLSKIIFYGEIMDKNPITKIVDWYNEAKKTEINDPDAIALATVDDTGFPNIRTVLLRKIDSDSFVFFTNYNSQKGNEIENNNNVAFSFHWKSLAKQIRIRGIAEKENGIVADDYYNSRALGSRIGAWASKQSSKLKNREELLERIALMEKKFKSNPPRPPFWGGIRIRPLSIEFWKEGKFRLHERELWKRLDLDQKWSIDNLYP